LRTGFRVSRLLIRSESTWLPRSGYKGDTARPNGSVPEMSGTSDSLIPSRVSEDMNPSVSAMPTYPLRTLARCLTDGLEAYRLPIELDEVNL